jgi:hypothetical protein
MAARFRSTPPRGGRPGRDRHDARVTRFDPRPRVGGGAVMVCACAGHGSFDPRPRVGGGLAVTGMMRESPVSIHAPAWGAAR